MALKSAFQTGLDYNQALMALTHQMAVLEASGLIRVAQIEPDLEYLFRHALVQDAAYASVLKTDRRRLHGAVGDVLETAYAGRLEDIAPVLGYHFEQAGDDERALRYYSLAGETAARHFALPEAVTHYSKVVEVARRQGGVLALMYRQRGLAEESLGQFEPARADYEESRAAAAAAGDGLGEWQALLDLGLLWTGRDYARASDFYQQAYQRAAALADRTVLAHTLNRLGNWHLNIEQPLEARRYHEQALEIFETLKHTRGVAETADLLGMTSFLSCDLASSYRYYQQALELFESLGDQRGLSSVLATLGAAAPNAQGNTILPVEGLPAAEARARRALRLASAANWRSGEAYALFAIAHCAIARGAYDEARQAVESGLSIARAIDHLQWLAAITFCQGILRRDVGDLAGARETLEAAQALAVATGSLHWQRSVSGMLATVYIGLGEFDLARTVLEPVSDPASPALTLGHRLVWHAWGDLALARGDPAEALRLADWLSASAPNVAEQGESRILRLAQLRSQALAELGRAGEAEAVLRAALPAARDLGAIPMTARFHLLLERLYRAGDRSDEAALEAGLARAAVDVMEASLSDAVARRRLRESYLGSFEE